MCLGDDLEIVERQPFGGPLTVRFGGPLTVRFGSADHVIGGTLASAMRVELNGS